MDAQDRLIKLSFIKADAHQLRNADVNKIYRLMKTALTAQTEPVAKSPAAMAGSKALAKAMSKFISYAVTCRKSNTEDWMMGLAEEADKFCEAFEEPTRWRFNGDTIVPIKEP